MESYSICEKYREANVHGWSDGQYYSDWFLYGIQEALGRGYPITIEILDNISNNVNTNTPNIVKEWTRGDHNKKIRKLSPRIDTIGGELL